MEVSTRNGDRKHKLDALKSTKSNPAISHMDGESRKNSKNCFEVSDMVVYSKISRNSMFSTLKSIENAAQRSGNHMLLKRVSLASQWRKPRGFIILSCCTMIDQRILVLSAVDFLFPPGSRDSRRTRCSGGGDLSYWYQENPPCIQSQNHWRSPPEPPYPATASKIL